MHVLPQPPRRPGQIYSNFVLYLLLLVYVSNQWCRYLFNYLFAVSGVDAGDSGGFVSIQLATDMTSTQYAILAGPAFSLPYVTFGMLAGQATSFRNRRNLIVMGLLMWNFAVVLLGTAESFWDMLAARIVLGIGQAFSAPATYSIITAYFTHEGKKAAHNTYAMGVYLGGAAASLGIAMAQEIGWRLTCHLTAMYGLLLSVLFAFMVYEPKRPQVVHAPPPDRPPTETEYSSWKVSESGTPFFMREEAHEPEQSHPCESVRVFTSSKVVLLLFSASCFRFMGGHIFVAFVPRFYMLTFPFRNVQFSLLNALVVSLGGAFSFWIGQACYNWEHQSRNRARLLTIPILGTTLSVPFLASMFLTVDFRMSMFMLTIEYILAECWFAPVVAVYQQSLHPKYKVSGTLTFTFATALSGSLATLLFAWTMDNMSTRPKQGQATMRFALVVSLVTTFGMCALLLAMAKREIHKESVAEVFEREPLLYIEDVVNVDVSDGSGSSDEECNGRSKPALPTTTAYIDFRKQQHGMEAAGEDSMGGSLGRAQMNKSPDGIGPANARRLSRGL